MAIASKKVKVTDKARVIVYVGDQKNADGKDYPIFISVPREVLKELGGVKKFDKVPSETYTTPSGLTYTVFKDNDGLLWKQVKGTKKGVNYSNTTLVTVGENKNPLIVYLTKTEVKRVAGKTATAPTTKEVKIKFPTYATSATVISWLTKNVADALTVGYKFGDVLIQTGKILKSTRGATGSQKKPQTPKFSIMGTMVVGAANTGGGINKAKGKSDKAIIIATFSDKAAEQFGFTKVEPTEIKDITDGTKVVGNNADKRFLGYSVVNKPVLRDAVWRESGENAAASLSTSGTGTTVKVRFNYLDTGRSSVATGKAVRTSTYVKFAVPSGVPVGMIAKFIVNLKRFGVSFQISTDGKNFGTSYPLPNKPGMGLQRITTTARTAGKVRNRRRGAKKA
jgi:hypothetical protein